MSYVEVRYSGDNKKDKHAVEDALREFKKQVKKNGTLNEIRRRESYMSPSKYRRFRRNESIKRRKREMKKQEWANKKTGNW